MSFDSFWSFVTEMTSTPEPSDVTVLHTECWWGISFWPLWKTYPVRGPPTGTGSPLVSFFDIFSTFIYLVSSGEKSSNLQESSENLFSLLLPCREVEEGYLFFNPLLTPSLSQERSSFVWNCCECTQRQFILSQGLIYLQVGGAVLLCHNTKNRNQGDEGPLRLARSPPTFLLIS